MSVCTSCPLNSNSGTGASTCTCNAGYSQSGSGSSLTCTNCGPGTYSSAAGSTSCLTCPQGRIERYYYYYFTLYLIYFNKETIVLTLSTVVTLHAIQEVTPQQEHLVVVPVVVEHILWEEFLFVNHVRVIVIQKQEHQHVFVTLDILS